MNERSTQWTVRGIAWPVLAVAAAVFTPSSDVLTMLLVYLAALALFEAGFFVVRQVRGPGKDG